QSRAWHGVIAAYRDRLPVTAETPVITLHEGGTPLLPAPVLSDRTGCEVYLKVEGLNPTGSFKDRGMTVAISMAAGAGANAASGAAPIVTGRPVLQPQTIATAIRIGNPASWQLAEAARDASGGIIESVTDREILAAYRLLAAKEAVFGELASSASVAGLLRAS